VESFTAFVSFRLKIQTFRTGGFPRNSYLRFLLFSGVCPYP
jgi:hypothetical protein